VDVTNIALASPTGAAPCAQDRQTARQPLDRIVDPLAVRAPLGHAATVEGKADAI
jgi:hypothetical protein